MGKRNENGHERSREGKIWGILYKRRERERPRKE